MKKDRFVVLFLLISVFFGIYQSWAAQTSGGVNWLDPLQYTKPAFMPITVPDEATCPNKYYVDLSNGAGSSCSQASPCKTLGAVAGKTGMNGGPAYVYVKGNGTFSITSGNFKGSLGNEVVIKPWPGVSSVSHLDGPNNIENSSASYIIIDGGPSMLFSFEGSSGYGEGNSNGAAININSKYITFYRSQILVNNGTEGVGIARNGGNVTGTQFINCEFYDNGTITGTSPLMYPGGGNNCNSSSTVNNTTISNCIFRDAGPEAIEFNPRTLSDGVSIEGNAFHNIGKISCGTAWLCRPAIVVDGPSCGGVTRNITITNNLMWDIGSGGVWDRGGANTAYYYNNTIYDYGKGGTGIPNPQGISGYTNGGQATVRNNIIYAPNGTAPFDGSHFVKSNNICVGCDKGWNATTFLSTDPNSPDFLKIGPSSPAKDAGVNVGVTIDYEGNAVPYDGGYDIGAFEYAGVDKPPAPPENLHIVQ